MDVKVILKLPLNLVFQLNESIKDATIIMKLLPIVGTFLQVNEFLCYLFIYYDIYKHNKNMAINSVISSDVFNNRQKHNSQTLNCQVACFIVEGLFTFHLLIVNVLGTNFSSKEISLCFRVSQFAIITLLQISTSKDIIENSLFANFKKKN